MKHIEFYKMEGAGNDFVVFDNRLYHLPLEKIISLTPVLCNRRFGIGADGLLVLQNSDIPNVDYTMIYRNADGSDAGMCGNGSRCLALFAKEYGFSNNQVFNVHDSIYQATVHDGTYQVSIRFPDVRLPKKIGIDKTSLIQVYPGTEHVVVFESEDQLTDEEYLVAKGREIRNHELLSPKGSNVNFVFSMAEYTLDLQTYERGVEDLTLACGTGSIASAIAHHFSTQAHKSGDFCYKIHVKGGLLQVSFDFNTDKNLYTNIELKGPATFVFKGIIDV